jgi:hypothetical protein
MLPNRTRINNQIINKLKRYSILTSYIAGLPLGLLGIYLTIMLPSFLDRCGFMATMMIVAIYWKSILGLFVSFLIALRIGGINAFNNISNNESLLLSSFKYSLTINKIIWPIFALIAIIDNLNNLNDNSFITLLIAPILLFIFYLGLTTFTLGYLVCSIIERKIANEMFEINEN